MKALVAAQRKVGLGTHCLPRRSNKKGTSIRTTKELWVRMTVSPAVAVEIPGSIEVTDKKGGRDRTGSSEITDNKGGSDRPGSRDSETIV